MSGLMFVTGYEDEERPVRVGPSIIDKSAGHWGAMAVLAALLERERTGKGQEVVVSLLGAVVDIVSPLALKVIATGENPARQGSAGGRGGPVGTFKTGDGKWVMIMVGNEPMYRRFCQVVGREEMIDDPRFRTLADRIENHEALLDVLKEIALEWSADDWVKALLAGGVAAGPVYTVSEFIADPEVARQYFWSIERSTGNQVPQIHTPLSLINGAGSDRSAPALLGQHTDEVLSGMLGLGPDELASLRKTGVVR
jgi:crotonobetainyl-CoA:carnitine CoA-transferase CaiB-like acyl-CoA transferase